VKFVANLLAGTMKTEDFTDVFKGQNLIKVITDKKSGSEQHWVFVIGLSNRFVATNEMLAWRSDGLRIYPIERISKFVLDDKLKNSQEILKWNGVNVSTIYDWLDLGTFQSLFNSIKMNKKTIAIILGDIAEVGEVRFTTHKTVNLKALDAHGQWLEEMSTVSFDEISSICIDDEYSTILRAYADEIEQNVPEKKTKIIHIQIQPDLDDSHEIDELVMLMKSIGLNAEIEKPETDESYLNLDFNTSDPKNLWTEMKLKLLNDPKLGNWMKKVSIIVCEGDFGWDDYLLLWSFGDLDELDEL